MLSFRKIVILLVMLVMLIASDIEQVLACSTCGCSELCPLSMVEDADNSDVRGNLLSDSIWGNIILKIAYQRDVQIQKLTKHRRASNAVAAGGVSTAIGGTFAQNIVSMATLNPPEGQSDSYLPGGLGLGLSALVNVAFDGNILINWRLSKKVRARQFVIKSRVESILNHLEHSEAACPDAQSDLADIVGERAASDCIKLWQSSHTTAALLKDRTISEGEKTNEISNGALEKDVPLLSRLK